MTIIATGIDLANNVFAVHGVNGGGVVQMRQPKVARAKLGALIAGLPAGVLLGRRCTTSPTRPARWKATRRTDDASSITANRPKLCLLNRLA